MLFLIFMVMALSLVLSKLISHHRLHNKVFLHGHVSNISHHLLQNNLFVFTSTHEGFGKAPLEALFLSLPVICNQDVDMLSSLFR